MDAREVAELLREGSQVIHVLLAVEKLPADVRKTAYEFLIKAVTKELEASK